MLGRAAMVIGELQSPSGLASAIQRKYAPFFEMYIEDYREDLPSHVDPGAYPLVHLAYWHCRLLAYLLNPSAKIQDIMWPARESSRLLTTLHLASPLHQHFLVLTSLCLSELSKNEGVREEAEALLSELTDPAMPETAWDGLVRDKIAEMRPSTTAAIAAAAVEASALGQNSTVQSAVEAAASQGLQHLADLATASVAEKAENPYRTALSYEDMGFDPRAMLADGYLNFVREPAAL